MPLQIWFFFVLSACMGTSNSWSDSDWTLPFLSLLRKWKSHLPKKGKWLYESSLNMQPVCQPSVPEGCFCGLAGEEPYPELSLYASSLFPQHLFPLPFWSMLPMQIYVLPPKQRFSCFWWAPTGCFATCCPALNLIHFQHEHLDQLVLMLASLEQQTEQVLSVFPWAFIFLAPPQSPSLSPAATAPASEKAAAAAFQKWLHQLRLSLLSLMLLSL